MYFNYKETNCEDNSLVKIHGRTIYNSGLYISWSNSGVELEFTGDRIEFHFGSYEDEQPVYVKAYTEKGEQRFGLFGGVPKVVLDFECDKAHTVKLLRVTEGEVPLILENIRIYGEKPEFLTPPADKKLRLEFLGDSITAGYGVLAPQERDVRYSYEQDSTKAYAYMTAQLLDADIRTEAISGQGVYRNCGGEVGYQFKRIFDMSIRVKDGYDHSQWAPDVMILNCGTNDVPGGTDYDTMYKEADFLIDKVRAVYPETKIVWTYGLMNEKYHGIFEKLASDKKEQGDKNIYYLPLEIISAEKNEKGAVGHPNVNASVRTAEKLSKFILDILK